jgi:hypothetical protein
MSTRGRPDGLAVIGAWANAWYWYLLLALAIIYLPLLFPDGRLPSRRWSPVAVIASIGTAGIIVLGALGEPLIGQRLPYQIHNPIGIAGLPPVEENPAFAVFGAIYVAGAVAATAAMVVRFRRSSGVERQQLKWFLYTVALLPLVALSDYLPVIGGFLFAFVLLALPTAIGVAVLRYRLYDIDLIIRRTLVYAVLTAALALVYFGSVAILQSLVVAVSGRPSAVTTVISTLGIAALFAPLRQRVQGFMDHRFYRRKYDAARTLADFGATVRDETDLERLCSRLEGVVRETMQPANVNLWLIATTDRRPRGPVPGAGRPSADPSTARGAVHHEMSPVQTADGGQY